MPPWLGRATEVAATARGSIAVDVALRTTRRPAALLSWAAGHGLYGRWEQGADWAGISGTTGEMSRAFGVPIRTYRGSDGVEFAAAAVQPAVPAILRATVAQVGHLITHRAPSAPVLPHAVTLADVPPGGLSPQATLAAYDATPLARAGYTGKGDTAVLFSLALPSQPDLDAFSREAGLPVLHPVAVGTFAQASAGWVEEVTMDAQVVHALAPDARIVVVDVGPTFDDNRQAMGELLANTFDQAAARYPGTVWSMSVTWGCNAQFDRADLLPVEDALEAAERTGVTVFNASGDADGLECKEFGTRWADAPAQVDVGVDPISSLPAVTGVGGTLLSVDAEDRWVAEETWTDSAAQLGSSGGIDPNWARPSWQRASGIENVGDTAHRLTPDIAADGDPGSGMHIVWQGHDTTGGGTSQSTPLVAGLMVLIDEYLRAHGGHAAGALNPLLYRIARGASRPAFHDVTLGGNAVFRAGPGYDPITGLGSPDVANLAADLLDLQRSGG